MFIFIIVYRNFNLAQQAAGGKAAIQTKRNLCLTMDWNLPDLALSEIFQRDDDMKYNIPTELFDKALLGKKLEPFVDLFLDKDFALHRYLKSDKLVELFNKAKDREFLTTTSLEGILGLTGVNILEQNSFRLFEKFRLVFSCFM